MCFYLIKEVEREKMQLQTPSMPATVSPSVPGTPAVTMAQDVNLHERSTTSTFDCTDGVTHGTWHSNGDHGAGHAATDAVSAHYCLTDRSWDPGGNHGAGDAATDTVNARYCLTDGTWHPSGDDGAGDAATDAVNAHYCVTHGTWHPSCDHDAGHEPQRNINDVDI